MQFIQRPNVECKAEGDSIGQCADQKVSQKPQFKLLADAETWLHLRCLTSLQYATRKQKQDTNQRMIISWDTKYERALSLLPFFSPWLFFVLFLVVRRIFTFSGYP